MTCCLNPRCKQKNPSHTDAKSCGSCGTQLVSLLDRYRPVERIGEGQDTVTYLARDQRSDKKCVIKQLIVDNSTNNELFEQEAAQLKDLRNSQIPTILAYHFNDQYLYLVQEFITGQNLEEYLKKGRWNEEQIKDFLNTLLPVLKLVHEKKIIHCNIKLKNIMLRDDRTFVLINFCGSKLGAANIGYVPSEQTDGIVKPASDLYSLGVACFSLLTRKNPRTLFQDSGYSWTSKWQQHLDVGQIEPELAKILDKLLQKDDPDRYQSAEDVSWDLQKLNRPVPANPSVQSPPDTGWQIGCFMVIISFIILCVVVSCTKKQTSETYYKSGVGLLCNDNKQAIEAFTKAIDLNSDYFDAYIGRGNARYNSGDKQGAIEDYDLAIKHNPDNSDAHRHRGNAKYNLGDKQGAIEDYTQAAELFKKQGRSKDSQDVLKRVKKLSQ